MSTRAVRSRLALAVVPVFVFALFLSGRTLLKCDADGVARSACCCASDMHGGDTPPGPRVSERCCCDSTVVGPAASTSAVTPRESIQPPTFGAVETTSATAPLSEPAPLSLLEVARSAWPPNVPLFVLKSALLI
jgi:hypothetical protein